MIDDLFHADISKVSLDRMNNGVNLLSNMGAFVISANLEQNPVNGSKLLP